MATKQKDKPATPSYQYDAIVIGTGPGGEGVAMQLAKAGKKVAVIELSLIHISEPTRPY